ncbi:MAG: acyltransferase family protein [Clostridiales bacterium]|nr:acyltransferase family protein [Clostridiales bacterium]
MISEHRKRQIDLLRGLAIFLMLWGHCIQYCCGGQFDFFGDQVFKVIYSFHMPLLMLISGYLFSFSEQKRNMTELIGHKVKTLLYPVLTYTVLNLVLTKGVIAVITGTPGLLLETPPLTELWFLWSVLACSIVLTVAVKATGRPVLRIMLVLTGFFVVALFPCNTMNVYMYPYFVLGYYYARYEDRLTGIRKPVGILSIIILVLLLTLYEKKHFIYTTGLFNGSLRESLSIDIFRWAVGLFGSVAVIFVVGSLFSKMPDGKLSACFERLGRDSLAVYYLSFIFLSFWLPLITDKMLSIFPGFNWNGYILFYDLIFTPAIAMLYSAMFLLMIRLFRRTGIYKLIFGR